MLQDLKYTFRSLGRSPLFSILVILILALGIGANTAIFTLFDQILLRRLPVRDPDRLVLLDHPGTNLGSFFGPYAFSYPMYARLRDGNGVFDGLLARFPVPLNLTRGGETRRVNGVLVSGNYFSVLGLQPELGRLLDPTDDLTPGSSPVIVLSHSFWMRGMGGDRAIIGQPVLINGRAMTVVGVGPEGFHGLQAGVSADVFMPLMMKQVATPAWDGMEDPRTHWLNLVARLKPGIPSAAANAGSNVLLRQILEEELQQMGTMSERFRTGFLDRKLVFHDARTGFSTVRDAIAASIHVLMGMVALVLLIACANVSNLVLTRSAARSREMAVRQALGAGAWRISRQLMMEGLVLSLIAGGLGLVIAGLTAGFLLRNTSFGAAGSAFHARPDERVLLFGLAASIVSAVGFSLGPALRSLNRNLITGLHSASSRTTGNSRQIRLRRALVAGQVALSLTLLVGAGLFARSLSNLRHLNPGFDVDDMLTFSLDPSLNGYDDHRTKQLITRLTREIGSLPGVQGISSSEVPLLTGAQWRSTIHIEGYQAGEAEDMSPAFNTAGPDYFRTAGMPLLQGREFREDDTGESFRVAVINQSMALHFFGNESALGRRLGLGDDGPADIEVVGVVADGRLADLRSEIPRVVYVPILQSNGIQTVSFYVRSSLSPDTLGPRIREILMRADANLPIYDLKTMETQLGDSIVTERLLGILSLAFGGLATLLAAIGLYGVVSFSAAQRVREIGIRMALGADRSRVLMLVLGEASRVALAGLGAGLIAAWGAAVLIRSQLYETGAGDPAAWVGAIAVLGSVALLAAYLPARKAALADPVIALRGD